MNTIIFLIKTIIIILYFVNKIDTCTIERNNKLKCNNLEYTYYLRYNTINTTINTNLKLYTIVYYTDEYDNIISNELVPSNYNDIYEINNILYNIMKKTKYAAHIHNPMFSMTLINPLAKIVKLDDIDYKIINKETLSDKESIQYTIIYTLFDKKSNFIACYRLNSKKFLDIECDSRIVIDINFNYPKLTLIKYLEHVTNYPPNAISIINKHNLTTFPLKYEKVNLETAYTYLISNKINCDSILYKSISNDNNKNLQLITIEKIKEYLKIYILKENSKYFNINKNISDICNLNIDTSYEFINPFKDEYCIKNILKKNFNYSISLYDNKSIILSRNKTLKVEDKYIIINLQNKFSEDIFNEIIQLIKNYLNRNNRLPIDKKLLDHNSDLYLRYRIDNYIYIVDNNLIFSYKPINETHYYFTDMLIRKLDIFGRRIEYVRSNKTCTKFKNPYIHYDYNTKKIIFSNNNSYIVCVDDNNISFNCTNIKESTKELYCLKMKINCTKPHIESKIFCYDLQYTYKTIYNNEKNYIKIALGLNNLYIYTNLFFGQNFNIRIYKFEQISKVNDIIYYECINCTIQDINVLENEIDLNLIKMKN